MGSPRFDVDTRFVGVDLGAEWKINTSQAWKLAGVELALFVGNANNAIDARKEKPLQPTLPKVGRFDSDTFRSLPGKIGVIIVCFVECADPIAVATTKPGQAWQERWFASQNDDWAGLLGEKTLHQMRHLRKDAATGCRLIFSATKIDQSFPSDTMDVQRGNWSEPIKRFQVFICLGVWTSSQAEMGFETGCRQMVGVPQTNVDNRTRVPPVALVRPEKNHSLR